MKSQDSQVSLDSFLNEIYNKNISRIKEEEKTIISQAKKEADKIISNAKREAQEIVSSAKKQSQIILADTKREIKLFYEEVISKLKSAIAKMFARNLIKVQNVKSSLKDSDFTRDLILEILRKWDPSAFGEIKLLVFDKNLQSGVKKALTTLKLSGDIEIEFKNTNISGFKIIAKDDSFEIDFTEDKLTEIARQILSDYLKEFLFSNGSKNDNSEGTDKN